MILFKAAEGARRVATVVEVVVEAIELAAEEAANNDEALVELVD